MMRMESTHQHLRLTAFQTSQARTNFVSRKGIATTLPVAADNSPRSSFLAIASSRRSDTPARTPTTSSISIDYDYSSYFLDTLDSICYASLSAHNYRA